MAFCPASFPHLQPCVAICCRLADGDRRCERTYGKHFLTKVFEPIGPAKVIHSVSAGRVTKIQSLPQHIMTSSRSELTYCRLSIFVPSIQSFKRSKNGRWELLILPIGLNVLGAIFLIIKAFLSHRHKVRLWKGSNLALLYHGLAEGAFDALAPYATDSEMAGAAQMTSVRLAPSRTGKILFFAAESTLLNGNGA